MPFLDGNPVVITKRNVDDFGNPISIKQMEVKQVMDIHNCIPVDYSIDRNYPVEIFGMYQTYDKEEIDEDNFFVDYDQGILYFHPKLVGKTIKIVYMGTGYILISSNRIYRYNHTTGSQTSESIEASFEKVENLLNTIIQNGGTVNPTDAEVIAARTEADGFTHASLGDRLNAIDKEIAVMKTLIRYTNTITVQQDSKTVSVGIGEYNPKTDSLSVYLSGVRLIEGVDFSLDQDNKTITCSKGNWVTGDQLYFEVLKKGDDTTPPPGTTINATSIILTKPIFGENNVESALIQAEIQLKNHTHNYLPLSGGTMTGEINMGGKALRLSAEHNGNARIGVEASSGDVFIANTNNNWFRIKPNKTLTIAGQKVYTALDKPTPAEIGALPLSGGTMTGNLALGTQHLVGAKDTTVLRDHGNGNVTLSAGVNTSGVTGDLYLGYNTGVSYKTNNVRLERPLTWKGTKVLVNESGLIPWANIVGKPTPVEIGAANVDHGHSVINKHIARPTSADIAVIGDGGLRLIQATSSMTTSKPVADGHILHFEWDNTGGYSSQLFIQNSKNSTKVQVRGMSAGVWGSWDTLYSNNNKPNTSDVGILSKVNNTSYWGLAVDGVEDTYIRTPKSGLIPNIPNGANGNGGSSLGTTSWRFANVWTTNINGVSVANLYHTGSIIDAGTF